MNWIFLRKALLFNETSEKNDPQLFPTKLTEKIPDFLKKTHFLFFHFRFLRKKNTKTSHK